MRIGNYANEDINLTSSSEVNALIRQALDEVLEVAIKSERFASETIQNNFIAKLMIWCNEYLEGISFHQDTPPKCLFYGPIKRHEVYFLMLLALTGMDVVYFNPSGDTVFRSIVSDALCQTITLGTTSSTLIPYEKRVASGVVVEKVTTYAKKATNELAQTLYGDTGIYKPWQFSDGTTRPIIMDSVIEDTMTYWNQPARLRPGFKTEGKVVYTPAFFTKICGAYRNINEYYELIQTLRQAPKCVFYETPHLTNVNANFNFGQSRSIQYHNMPSAQTATIRCTNENIAQFNQQDLYSLAYCLNPDLTIKREEIKQHVLYKKMLTFRTELQEFILSKLEETFANHNLSFFKFNVTDKERVRLMAAFFTLEDALLNLIESYDFTEDIPKLVLYVNSREVFNQDDAMLLGLFRQMGLDIILLSPNGANNLETVISEKFINVIKLDEFIHDLPLKSPNKKGSFFSKLFR